MSDFSATDAAFTGIRFVREHPVTAAIWAGVQILISLALGAITVVTVGPSMVQLRGMQQQRPADPREVLAVLGHLLPFYALLLVIGLLINAVLYATMSRAVLQPSEERLGYIRFGMDEARQCLLVVLWFLLTIAAEIVGFVAAFVPTFVLSLAAPGFRGLFLVVFVLLVLAALIYLFVRLSLAYALTFDTRRVNLFGSWALTRGHVWKMLGTYLLVVGVGLAILLLTLIITVAVASVLGGIGAMASIFQPNVATLGAFFLPARLAVSVIWAVVTPLFWALFLMPPVEIYRQLRQGQPALR